MARKSIISRVASALRPAPANPRARIGANSGISRVPGKPRMYYEGTRTKGNGSWTQVSSDANSEIRPALQRLREASRQLVRNNGHASHARSVIAANTIGDGIVPHITTKNQTTKDRLENLLTDHFDTTACDAGGRMDLYGLQDLVMKAIFESGEVIVRIRPRKASDKLPLAFQLEVLEADYINMLIDGPRQNGNFAIEGIEFNAAGRIVGYHLYKQHPGAMYRTTVDSEFVAAEFVLHVFRIDRPGQARGVPWLAPILVKMNDFQDFTYAQLVRQKVAACFAAFVIGTGDDGSIDDTKLSEQGYPLEALEPGIIQRLRDGEQIEFGSPPTVGDFGPYTNVTMHEISAGLDISYEMLTGDLSGVNFSSGRMGWLEAQRQITGWQRKMLVPQMLAPIGNLFMRYALIAGAVGPGERVKLDWTPPKREMISPKDEIPYAINGIRAGLFTLSDWRRQHGYDPDKVDAEYAEEQKRQDKLGLIFDSDARHRSQIGAAVQTPVEAQQEQKATLDAASKAAEAANANDSATKSDAAA